MRKKKEAIKKAVTKTANTVKEAAEKVVDKVTEETPEIIDSVSQKAEEFMNSPIIEETKEQIEENIKAVKNIRTRITDVTLEIFETCVTLDAIEKAVKKDVAQKELKGEVKIYINAEKRAAYYTVNDEGSDVYKIDLRTI